MFRTICPHEFAALAAAEPWPECPALKPGQAAVVGYHNGELALLWPWTKLPAINGRRPFFVCGPTCPAKR